MAYNALAQQIFLLNELKKLGILLPRPIINYYQIRLGVQYLNVASPTQSE